MGNGTTEEGWDGVDGGDLEEGVWGMAKMYLRDQPPAGPLEPIMEEEAEEVDPMAWVRLQMAEVGDQNSPPRSLLMGAAVPGGRIGVAEVLSSDINVVCAVDSFAREAKVGGGMLARRRRRSTGSIMFERSESEMESLRQEAMQATEAHACAKKDAHNSMQACLRSLLDVAASLDEAERQYSETAQEVHASYQQLQKDMRAVDSAVQQAAADKPWGGWVRAKSSTQPRGGTETVSSEIQSRHRCRHSQQTVISFSHLFTY